MFRSHPLLIPFWGSHANLLKSNERTKSAPPAICPTSIRALRRSFRTLKGGLGVYLHCWQVVFFFCFSWFCSFLGAARNKFARGAKFLSWSLIQPLAVCGQSATAKQDTALDRPSDEGAAAKSEFSLPTSTLAWVKVSPAGDRRCSSVLVTRAAILGLPYFDNHSHFGIAERLLHDHEPKKPSKRQPLRYSF